MNELNETLQHKAPHASWLPLSDIQDPIAAAHQLRSETLANLTGGAFDRLVKLVYRLTVAPILRAWQRQRTVAVLSQLDDQILEDIGLERCDIQKAARKAVAKPAAETRPGLFASLRRSGARRAAIRELEGLSDRVLRDIGVPRNQITPMVDGIMSAKTRKGAAKGAPTIHELLRRTGLADGRTVPMNSEALAKMANLTGDLDRLPAFLDRKRMDSPTIQDTRTAGAA